LRRSQSDGGVLAIVIFLVPAAALGQSRSTIEIELGPGFALGGGSENPAPSLPTLSLGAAFWLVERWGLTVTHVRSHGKDLREPPVESIDRVFAGAEDLRYTRAVARYRRRVVNAGDVVLGVGFVLGGSFTDIDFLKTPTGLHAFIPRALGRFRRGRVLPAVLAGPYERTGRGVRSTRVSKRPCSSL
jgi:hypothetical protein